MEDVLYDYHITQGLASQRPSDSIPFLSHLYRQAVFEKYGIAQADFDRSMEWYARHTSQLSKIYERVGERLGESGGSGSGSRMNIGRDGERLTSDTAQIWQGPQTLLLSSQGVQHYVFQVPADTSY
ncbi:lipoprotein, partial [gut metagenome]